MNRFFLVSLIFTVAIALSIFREASSSPIIPCIPCSYDCDLDPPGACPWGESRNDCGRRVCSKGPGERCGGHRNYYGHCGEGLVCRPMDEKCHGCSLISLDCY